MKLKYSILFISALFAFLAWQNNEVAITEHNYTNDKLPNKFNGFKILHISDLHNKKFYGRLTNKIKKINPDIIVITGDLIDRRRTNINSAMELIEDIVKIAPTYYVSGNHEQLSQHYTKLKEELNKFNVINMDDFYTAINKGGSEIGLIGIADPAINANEKAHLSENNVRYVISRLNHLTKNLKTDFNILLSHRPELLNVYKKFNIDLVFSGHAHGGQIRIPLLGGILSPNQGFFPKYSEGMHREEATSMAVSRGLGNSLFPFRIFNPPELVVVILSSMS